MDLVLCGHAHIWQRTGLLDGHYGTSETLSEASRLNLGDGKSDGDGPYRKKPGPHGGTVYVVAGSSVLGSPMPKDHPAMVFGSNALGVGVIDIEGERLHMRYLDVRGRVVDEFVIEKAAGTATRGAASSPASAPTTQAGQARHDVILVSAGENTISVIKVVRELTSLGLKDAKDLVDGAPKVVRQGLSKEQAEQARKQLEAAGAKVEIR